MTKPEGWKNEPARHALAAKGVKTQPLESRMLTKITMAAPDGDGEVKAAVFDLDTHGWHYETGKPDDFTMLLMEIQYEDIGGAGMVNHTVKQVLMLKSETYFDKIDKWLAENLNDVAVSVWKGDHAHVKVIGRVTAANIGRDTGLPSAEVISRAETIADEE